jgi:Phenylpropionate dioxygenase and related ring-hydroxylating dioxygenases, large terminal subunit
MLVTEVWRTRPDGAIPTARYVDPAFAMLEHDRLWSRVWQIAGREEEIPEPGDVLEYEIGLVSILIVRASDGALHAMRNSCRHRGSKLVEGRAAAPGCLQCPYHGWRYALDGTLIEVVDPDDFGGALPDGLRLEPVRVDTFGGFVFVNLDADAEPLAEFLGPLPELLAPYRLDEMRIRLARTTVLPANWKAVIDAFNEGYHVQALHAQILPWTDDTSIAYEQFETHARYGRLPGARRALQPSPRLGIDPVDVDEGEILAGMVAGLGGAFLRDERAVVEELRRDGPPDGVSMLAAFQARRRELMTARGFDVSTFADDELTSAQDVFWFPNLVGPIYPGSAILFRVRPNGDDVQTAINDTWVLEWPDRSRPARAPRYETVDDWRTFEWDPVTRQDYDNLERVQAGMRSGANEYLFTNPRQESNVVHMHRVIDRYLFG